MSHNSTISKGAFQPVNELFSSNVCNRVAHLTRRGVTPLNHQNIPVLDEGLNHARFKNDFNGQS